MKKQRKHYTPEEKVAILRRHLLEQAPISELCDKQESMTEADIEIILEQAKEIHSEARPRRRWLHHAQGHVGGAATGDLHGTGPEVGGCPETTADSSAASRLTNCWALSRSRTFICGGETGRRMAGTSLEREAHEKIYCFVAAAVRA
jgi:hypothetical protein